MGQYDDAQDAYDRRAELIFRAVIESLIEPTKEMRLAGMQAFLKEIEQMNDGVQAKTDFRRGLVTGQSMHSSRELDVSYQAMLREVLRDE